MRTFIISDTHFNHKNIIKYCNRPFKDVKEMNRVIIANWNKVATKDDMIFHLGDFALGDKSYIKQLVNQLNGKIVLIKGNHDYSTDFIKSLGFHDVHNSLLIGNVLLTHKPRPEYQLDNNVVNFHGHIHNYANENIVPDIHYNFSVENTNYNLVEYDFTHSVKYNINKYLKEGLGENI